MEPEILFQLIGVLLTLAGAAVSIYAAVQARRDTKVQRTLELLAVEQEYYRDLRQWADRAIELLTEAIFISHSDHKTADQDALAARSSHCRRDLSVVIEQGRLFLPNDRVEGFGAEKPPAYQGFRSPVLNPLVNAYRVLEKRGREQEPSDDGAGANKLWELRKEFVSHVQSLLDPRTRQQMLESLRAVDTVQRKGR